MMSDSKISCLITVDKILVEKLLNPSDQATISPDSPAIISKLRECPATDFPGVNDHESLAYTNYTSGNTGNPEGVAISY